MLARLLTLMIIASMPVAPVVAEVRLPSIFGDHMVLQRNQANPLWGWAEPGETVTVILQGQTHRVTAGDQGAWRVQMEPVAAGGPFQIRIRGANEILLRDVMVGEVWVCSGQSNMEWPVQAAKNSDLEIRTADYPAIRLIRVPHRGTQEPQKDFVGSWRRVTSDSIPDFSAVCYFFGRLLHQNLKVPVGLVETAWGASAAEAWVRRDLLDANPRFSAMMQRWEEIEQTVDPDTARADFERELEQWRRQAEQAREEGRKLPPRPWFRDLIHGQFRPSNLYNGMLKPVLGYGMRGVIWYQGETNAGRAYQYRDLFPLLIKNWRQDWGAGDFPFYWVQLADFATRAEEQDAPYQGPPRDSAWAELREAQTLTLAVPHTGEAVIIDLGEANDIHPVNKQEVAARLARIALAKDYGARIAHQSPRFRELSRRDSRLVLSFDHVGSGLETHNFNTVTGFALAGEDRRFYWAQAAITEDSQIEVWSASVPEPVAVRYAWDDDPVCNVFSKEGLPLTPFRSDDWPGVTEAAKR